MSFDYHDMPQRRRDAAQERRTMLQALQHGEVTITQLIGFAANSSKHQSIRRVKLVEALESMPGWDHVSAYEALVKNGVNPEHSLLRAHKTVRYHAALEGLFRSAPPMQREVRRPPKQYPWGVSVFEVFAAIPPGEIPPSVVDLCETIVQRHQKYVAAAGKKPPQTPLLWPGEQTISPPKPPQDKHVETPTTPPKPLTEHHTDPYGGDNANEGDDVDYSMFID